MKVSADIVPLAEQAGRCRRLAAGLPDGDTKVTLLALAREYERACLTTPVASVPSPPRDGALT
jgi:hypothetical protein